MPESRRLKAELARRAKVAKVKAETPKFVIEEFCFDKQIDFIRDPAKFKTAVCSRRAGKTIACAADLFNTAYETEEVNVLYITLNRLSAKRIIWKELLRIVKKYDPEAKIDNTALSITLANDSTIYVSGAKDATEIEKFRGMAIKKVYIDEAQSFRAYLQNLIDDVLVPALYDYDGTLCLIGTPGPVCAGTFYDASQNLEWGHHAWTILDNPHIKRKSGKDPAVILAAERKRRGIDESDPTYRRESLGQWVQDMDALVYKFDPKVNRYSALPPGKMEYVFGIDIGYNDADAIAVLGYSYEDKNVYLVEEFVRRKQDITDLVNQINRLRAKYKPVRMVMDAGALGKKIQAEITTRHAIPLEAAEKTRKLEYIKLLNDDLRTARFKALPNSRFEQDSYLVQWDRSDPHKPKISDTYHTDIGDAALYAWRECRHYLYKDPEPEIEPGTDAYMDAMEDEHAERVESAKNRKYYEADEQELEELQDTLESLFDDWDSMF